MSMATRKSKNPPRSELSGSKSSRENKLVEKSFYNSDDTRRKFENAGWTVETVKTRRSALKGGYGDVEFVKATKVEARTSKQAKIGSKNNPHLSHLAQVRQIWELENRQKIDQNPLSNLISARVVSTPPLGHPEARVTPDTTLVVSVSPEASREGVSGEVIELVKPDPCKAVVGASTDKISSVGDIASFTEMMSGEPTIVLAYDSEFQDTPEGRVILSYQFACINPRNPEQRLLMLLLPVDGQPLTLEVCLHQVITTFKLWESPLAGAGFTSAGYDTRNARCWIAHDQKMKPRCYKTFSGAVKGSAFETERAGLLRSMKKQGNRVVYKQMAKNATTDMLIAGKGNGRTIDESVMFAKDNVLPITLVSHYGKADLSAFDFERGEYFLPRISEIAGGWVTMRPLRFSVWLSRDHGERLKRAYPVRLEIRDTITQTPAEKRSLEDLGRVVGFEKLTGLDEYKECMSEALKRLTGLFIEYAARDAVICLEFCSELSGDNTTLKLTLPSAAAKAAQKRIGEYFDATGVVAKEAGESPRAHVNRVREAYNGFTQKGDGIAMGDHGLDWYKKGHLEPIDGDAMNFQNYCSYAYLGGLNACLEVGWIDEVTFDWDLENAYPSAMALVPDLDFRNRVISQYISNELLTFNHLLSPLTPFVGEVQFRFPSHVKYPCIPVKVEGSVVFPRSSDGLDCVYASGPEVYLALRLGAEVRCVRGYIGKVLFLTPDESGEPRPSRCLRAVARGFINDRRLTQEMFGKKSLQDLVLKTAVNSIYGKTAQDVSPSNRWNAYKQMMESIGGSAITSAYHANMTTSIVRAVLLATMNELDTKGYPVFSVTTDGLITTADETVLPELDLYGFKKLIVEARQDITGSSEMWAIKHVQPNVLNWNTRGNTALEGYEHKGTWYEGVNAHGGVKVPSGVVEDSPEDRENMVRLVAGTVGTIANSYKRPTGHREMTPLDPNDRVDFTMISVDRDMDLSFDMKRKPVESTIRDVQVVMEDGDVLTFARYETEPWDRVDEFLRAREVRKRMRKTGIKRAQDVRTFILKYENGKQTGKAIANAGLEAVRSILAAYHLRRVTIPGLDACRSRQAKCDWLNQWEISSKKINFNDYKNITRQERIFKTLPISEHEYIRKILEVLASHDPSEAPNPELITKALNELGE